MKTDKTKYFLNKFNPELAEVIVDMTEIINETYSTDTEPPIPSMFFFDDDYLVLDQYELNESYPQLLENQKFIDLANKLGPVKLIDSKGGYEGGGDHVHRVYHFENWDLYISFEGYYGSYSGKEYTTCRKVKPVMVQTYSWPNA